MSKRLDNTRISRRALLAAAATTLLGSALGMLPGRRLLAGEGDEAGAAADGAVRMVVHKTPTCGCCSKWVDHVTAAGFDVEVITVASTGDIRSRLGVPDNLRSCHTAAVGGYWVEGHVPADVIRRMLDDGRDDISGIAVPGMPIGSPGMEGPNPERYLVVAYGKDGKVYRYAERQGHSEPL